MNAKGACGDQIASYVAIEGSSILLGLVILGVPIVIVSRINIGRLRNVAIIVTPDAGAV
jgi:hypothetical protein